MPYVEGESLRERLTRQGRLSPSDTVRILGEVLDALGEAHRHGMVHRDIKPENIMLTGRHALVMDFGVAKAATVAAGKDVAVGGTLTTLGLAIGTPVYMSPEQAAGQTQVDSRADLYAVGVVGYEMLSGQVPFSGPTPQAVLAAHVTKLAKPLGQLCADARRHRSRQRSCAPSKKIRQPAGNRPKRCWPSWSGLAHQGAESRLVRSRRSAWPVECLPSIAGRRLPP